MPAKAYLIILKSGIFLSFISVFLVFRDLLFPFITSKQLYFNILIEILVVFWLALIIKYPEYRPKKSWISWGLISFFSAILLSTFFSIDFNLSFWGDIERMLGFFPLLHFLFYYFIIITVFKTADDWRNLFFISVGAALLISYYSLFKIPYSTIGNTAYVSGYVIFNIYFAFLLFYQNLKSTRKNELKWLLGVVYLALVLIMLLVMQQTRTRGAYVGLAVSFFVLPLLYIFFSQSKKIKIYSLVAIAVMAIVISLVFLYPNSRIVKNYAILNTITQISSKATTFQTRLISWKTAFKDFPNHPLLGTGYGNFAISFDKFFDPNFYNYTTSETYFDHAHNNLIDILSTTGLLGLFTYLLIFIAAFYYLINGLRKKTIDSAEFILLACLIIAYFIQNLAVFDSLVTYLSLMVMLGYVYWLTNRQAEIITEKSASGFNNKEIFTLSVTGFLMLAVIFQYNFKPWQMLKGTISGQIAFAKGDIAGGVEEYKKALSYNTVLDRDSRSSLINIITPNALALTKLDPEKAKEIMNYVISLAEENARYNPSDSMMQMQLAQALNTTSAFYTDKQNDFYFYSDRALKAIDKSIEASPGRVTIYFTKAQIYIMRNDKDNAIKTLNYAVGLNNNYGEGYCFMAKIYLYYKNESDGYKAMDKCLDLSGNAYLNPADFIKTIINHYAVAKENFKLILLYQKLATLENDPNVWVNLAKLYLDQGDKESAISAAQKASELNPAFKQGADDFIKNLK